MYKYKLGDIVKVLKESINHCSGGKTRICSYGTTGLVCDTDHQDDDGFIMIEAWDQDGEIDVFDYSIKDVELITDYTPYQHLHKFRTCDHVIAVDEILYRRTIKYDEKTDEPIYGPKIIIPKGTIGEIIYCGARDWSLVKFDSNLLNDKDDVCVDNKKIELINLNKKS